MKGFFVFIVCIFFYNLSFSQIDTTAPYKRFPSYPPVKILLPDSINFFTKDDLPKKKSVILELFNPQCSHCQHETEELIAHIDKFKDVQIIMATNMPFASMMSFREKYGLAKYNNIVVGQDIHYFLPTFFMIHNLPFHAFYDKKKTLISVHEGSLKIEDILKVF